MAAGEFRIYDAALRDTFNGDIDWEGTLAAALLSASHTIDTANDDTWSDVSGEEISDGDYDSIAVPSPAISVPSAGTVRFDCGDLDYGDPVTIEAKFLVIVEGTAGSLNAGDKLLAIVDLDEASGSATYDVDAGEFLISINANGVLQVAQS